MKKRLQKKLSKRTAQMHSQKVCEGCLGGYHCCDCYYLNTSRRDGTYYYCEKHKSWHRPTDYYCSVFKGK